MLLAVDTATSQVGVALGSDDAVVAEVRLVQGRRHAEQLAPAISYVLREAGVTVEQLSAVAVGIGPGLFTGVRVGVTTAKVVAHTLGVPVVPVPSLDLVAHPLRVAGRPVVAVIDARRGEIYWAAYRPVRGGLERTGDYRVGSPDELASELSSASGGPAWLAAGEGALRYGARLAPLESVDLAPPAFSFPSPSALLEVASERRRRGEGEAAHAVRPLYLRKTDAELNWERGRRGGSGAGDG